MPEKKPSPFTPTFIAMAIAAQEIQALRPRLDGSAWNPPHPGMGSFFCKPYRDGWEFSTIHWDNDTDQWMIGGYADDEDEFFWLPRLDQLTDMIGDFITWTAVRDLDQVLRDVKALPHLLVDWHEVALVVVMRDKFRKRWNGEAWVTL